MPLSGSGKCVKYLVFFFNLLFMICGLGLMGTGVYVQLTTGGIADLQSVKFINGSILVIAVGAAIAMVSFFGCCGALKENRCFLSMFFTIVLLVFAAEAAGTTMGYLYREKIQERLRDDLNSSLMAYGEKEHITKAYDVLQKKEKCCGVTGYKDWQISTFSKGNDTIVPDSCCTTVTDGCGSPFTKDKIHTKGCYKKLETLLKKNLMFIICVGAGVALIQICALVFSMMLICRISQQD